MTNCKWCRDNICIYANHILTRYCNGIDIECENFVANTNADRIRSMTDEELAVEIAYWADNGDDPKELVNEILDYLKEPYETD